MTASSEKEILLAQYEEVKNQIMQTCLAIHRHYHEVKLVIITKFQPEEKIRWLLEAGHREFGESRTEEMQEKWSSLLLAYPDVKLHYIGQIQSRKIWHIVKYCHVVHSLDRIEIAEKIAHECSMQNKYLECLIQINTGAESQKGGVDPAEFPTFLHKCEVINGLIIKGIMCIPPLNQNPIPHFHSMQQLKTDSNLNELSMGMSKDYIEAITCGATMLRIGTKIMGSRS